MKMQNLTPPRRLLIPPAALLGLVFLFSLAPVAHAQSGGGYVLTNAAFTSASGTATNGPYSLSATFTPTASVAATNGGYSLTGGFTSLYLVQTPGAPLLKIARSGAGVVLSWPDPSTGFKLQSTPTLVPPNWTDVAQPVVVVGSNKTVTVSVALGRSQFYRLVQP